MTINDLLAQLDGVRRSGSGWIARCPAHDDRSPSLSVREGNRGLLVKCWSGCAVAEIVDALGIEVRDLFYDSRDARPHVRRETARHREIERERRAQDRRTRGALIDSRREAENLILSAKNIDISAWPDDKLGRVMDALGAAYHIIEAERLEEEVAA